MYSTKTVNLNIGLHMNFTKLKYGVMNIYTMKYIYLPEFPHSLQMLNLQRYLGKEHFIRVLIFFFSSRYTSPVQCWTHALAWSLRASKSSKVHGSGRRGQIKRCSIVYSSPQSQVASPSSYVSPPLHERFASTCCSPQAVKT